MNYSPVANATVTAKQVGVNTLYYGRTDSNGRFQMPWSNEDGGIMNLGTTLGTETSAPITPDMSGDISADFTDKDLDEEYKIKRQQEIEELEKAAKFEREEMEREIMEVKRNRNARIQKLNEELKVKR